MESASREKTSSLSGDDDGVNVRSVRVESGWGLEIGRLSEFWFHEPAELYERGLVYLSEQFSHLVVVITQVLALKMFRG